MKKAFHVVACMLIFQIGFAQDATEKFSKYFKAEKKYLVLPVENGALRRKVEIWVDGVKQRFLDIELADSTSDWNSFLQIDMWKAKNVELRVDKLAADSHAFSPIAQSDADTNSNYYHEKFRAQFHFSPKYGWTNDPNGMVYYKGEYHLFYQHNPYGRGWGNMTWGHAVSKDLLHWTHLDDAIHPNAAGPVFSGSAVVDEKNTSGLDSNNNSPMVIIHTGAEGWGQYLAWSSDGRNFGRMENAVVPRINKDNRDPKVIWHEPTNRWVMVLWVERGNNEQHTMQFLTSRDLKNWTPAGDVKGGMGNDRYLFECPEFFELSVEGLTGVKKWVLMGANTEYAIGSFDGLIFKPELERLKQQHGRNFYAPQTFNNEPNGRRIEIGWWRTHTDTASMSFNQSMSVPLELKLKNTTGGIRLTRMPVKELEALRGKTYSIGHVTLGDKSKNPLSNIIIELAEIRMQIVPGKARNILLNVRGVEVNYDVINQELIVDGVHAPAPLQNGKLNMIVYADRTGLEIFVNDGLMYMPVNINIADENRTLSLAATGGVARISDLKVYELNSIW